MSEQEETPVSESISDWSTGLQNPKRSTCPNEQNSGSVIRRDIEWVTDNSNSQSIWKILSHLM